MFDRVISFLDRVAALGWYLPPLSSDLILLAFPCALAALFLVLRGIVRPRRRMGSRAGWALPWPWTRRPVNWIIVDGSNVLYWDDGVARIETVRAVLAALTERGFTPGVVFDANAGYKISDGYKHDRALGQMVGLPEDRVIVVPKGTPADPVVLAAARDLKARIVSNDRFRDWACAHPEVATPGHVIRGGYGKGVLWLDAG